MGSNRHTGMRDRELRRLSKWWQRGHSNQEKTLIRASKAHSKDSHGQSMILAVNEMTGVCLSVQQACFTTAAGKLGYLAVLSMVLLQILARRWLWVGGCGCVRRELQSWGAELWCRALLLLLLLSVPRW